MFDKFIKMSTIITGSFIIKWQCKLETITFTMINSGINRHEIAVLIAIQH